MARAAAASALETLGARTCFRATSMPELGLEANVEFGYRVYVISCVGGRQYVGVETKHKAAERVRRHFSGGAAHYTKTFAPAELLLFWPAACAAVESYVFSALLACQPARQLSRLGGWTQTSSSPSAHACMVFEEQRRALRGDCFNCGGSHYAARCERIRGAHTRAPNAGRRSWSPLEARRSRSGSRGLWPQRLHRRCLLRRRQQSASSVGRLLVTPRVDARKWCARPLVLRGPS